VHHFKSQRKGVFSLKICLISVEIFAWGKYGGFGRATRTIGGQLAKRGHQICAVVPRRKGQKKIEILDGMEVFGFSPYFPWSALKLFKKCDAQIYHSCEPSFSSYLAMKAMPNRKHMVTFRDPRDRHDWKMEFDLPSLSKLQVIHNYLYESNYLVKKCIPQMDAVFTIGRHLIPKVKSMYGLKMAPQFLPTPVSISDSIRKSEKPTVCYLARLDRRKRPELFLNLAKNFPNVKFVAMGKSRDKKYDRYLRSKYANVKNLEMTGFINQFESDLHSKILEKSWVMINTATREALPNAFIEAAGHKCAILSSVDSDGFASNFGYFAKSDDFNEGLNFLLENHRWKERGVRGYEYIKNTFESNRVIDLHLEIYRKILDH
jgi:glycosyltransferase involved in cell wall biosynthesis